MSLLNVHIFAASAWIGVVGCETVMELTAHDPAARRLVARVHQWIDILFEMPLIATVLVTGAVLLARAWPPSFLLLVKIGAAMIAIVANFICVQFVRARVRAESDETAIAWTRRIMLTGYAVPFGLVALIIGLYGT